MNVALRSSAYGLWPLWETVLGMKGDPHLNPIHILSDLLIFGGFVLLAASWSVLFEAQRSEKLATTGPYLYIRHPRYAGFVVIMIAFLLQWPTIITLLMFPILLIMYVRLSRKEEQEMAKHFGELWRMYAEATPRWFPRAGRRPDAPTLHHS